MKRFQTLLLSGLGIVAVVGLALAYLVRPGGAASIAQTEAAPTPTPAPTEDWTEQMRQMMDSVHGQGSFDAMRQWMEEQWGPDAWEDMAQNCPHTGDGAMPGSGMMGDDGTTGHGGMMGDDGTTGPGGMMGGDSTTGPGGMMGEIDRHFIEQMIPHHNDAILMAEIALKKAEHQEIKMLAESIKRTQSEENAKMREWYKSWYDTDVPENASGMGMGGGMMMNGGMMGDATDMVKLESAKPFDKEFIEQMIPHHQMAIMMATMLLRGTEREETKALAQAIIAAQSREFDQMRSWYRSWYGETNALYEMGGGGSTGSGGMMGGDGTTGPGGMMGGDGTTGPGGMMGGSGSTSPGGMMGGSGTTSPGGMMGGSGSTGGGGMMGGRQR